VQLVSIGRQHEDLSDPDRRLVVNPAIWSDFGLRHAQRYFDKLADEVFMCGTAAEVTPLRSVDDHEIGAGEVTLQIQKAYLDTVRGQSERWGQWLDHVPQLART